MLWKMSQGMANGCMVRPSRLGMVAAAALALEAELFSAADVARQNTLLAAFGLPTVYHGTVQAQDHPGENSIG